MTITHVGDDVVRYAVRYFALLCGATATAATPTVAYDYKKNCTMREARRAILSAAVETRNPLACRTNGST